MIPDYLTFIRYQDKANVLYLYHDDFILLGFTGKCGFSFSRHRVWVMSGICRAPIGIAFHCGP